MALISPRQNHRGMGLAVGIGARDDSNAQITPGTHWNDQFGREYVYVRSASALVIGDCVRLVGTDHAANNGIAVNLGAGYAAGYTGSITFDTYGSNLPTTGTNVLQGWYAYVQVLSAAGEGDCYRVISNTTTTIKFDRGLDAALADDEVISLFNPWRVTQTTAAENELDGVALGTVTAGNYTWIQKRGLCTNALFRTDTAAGPFLASASDVSTRVGPSATAGALEQKSMTTTNPTIIQLESAIKSRASIAGFCTADGGAATIRRPVYLSCVRVGD